jgi:hypothetical protein
VRINLYLTTLTIELDIKNFLTLFLSRHFQGAVNLKRYRHMDFFPLQDEYKGHSVLIPAVAVRL